MSVFKLLLPATLFLTACTVETTEEKVARLEQFQGKTVNETIAIIGPPILHEGNKAIWLFDQVQTTYGGYYDPYFPSLHGRRHRIGHFPTTSNHYHCKFTAELKRNRIVAGKYEGNSCLRFAPRLPKEKTDAKKVT